MRDLIQFRHVTTMLNKVAESFGEIFYDLNSHFLKSNEIKIAQTKLDDAMEALIKAMIEQIEIADTELYHASKEEVKK